MRDYTYIDGNRFNINNHFRSLRFDIDRLDINWMNAEKKPDFVRGYRVVDHQEGETYKLHSEDADNLLFSLAYIFNKEDYADFSNKVDIFLAEAVLSKNFLSSEFKIKSSPLEVVH
jgi:hypothetical protein